uniref:NADH-ubiquinone oxidoreductase chain 6 n=1 Tax=Leuckartiara octona TaxID=13108 RepID=A0A0S2IAA5_9CNID|nr:NADH dehydrogenase subunit 6 [Leuckartiara octona]
MEQLFFLFSILLIGSAIMTITSSNPIHSVFWLVIVFLYSSGFLISLNFEFLALMIIIIYVGAIAILFLFIIMMLDVVQLRKINPINNIIPILFLIGVNIIIEAWWLFKYDNINFKKIYFQDWNIEISNHITNLGVNLYSEYAYPLLVISLLLLIAMIGAIVLTLELGLITRKQNLSSQHHRNNSWI